MSLLSKKKVIKVKLEATKGTKIAGDQAVLVYDLEINPTSPFIQRPGSGLYLGNTVAGTVGQRMGTCTFSKELQGTGSGGADLGLAILLQGCGLAQTGQVYQVHSSYASQETISIDVFEDGLQKTLYGAMGNVTFEGEVGQRVICNFEFTGIYDTVSDVALPAYAPATTAAKILSSGTFTMGAVGLMISRFSINMQNNVVLRPDVDGPGGAINAIITNFDPEVSFDPEQELVATYDYYGIWIAATEGAFALSVGDGTDDKFAFSCPKVQPKSLTEADRDGIASYDYVGQANMNTGDDSVVLTVTDDNP